MRLSKRPSVLLLAAGGFAPCVYAASRLQDRRILYNLIISSLISIAGFFVTKQLIPLLQPVMLRANLFGKDINKRGTKEGEKKVPESLGLAPGLVFLVCIIFFQLLHFYDAASALDWVSNGFRGPLRVEVVSLDWHVDYNAALATICFMLFLGFADDVLDIPWRVKLLLPAVASLPLVLAYGGGTGVSIPKPLRACCGLPAYLELGLLYRAYIVALAVFSTNSINILAGVNGLEAGQTFIVACAVLFHNLTMLAGPAADTPAVRDGHLFSLYLMLPLAATTLALLHFNWFPSQVFVGDTFTYFAGMALAVAGILGHFSETLLILLVPQILNFVYSLPQLAKIVPCPRHRLPTFDPQSRLLFATPNWNLVNLTLQLLGPCTEQALCIRLLLFQALCCVGAFALRNLLAGVYK